MGLKNKAILVSLSIILVFIFTPNSVFATPSAITLDNSNYYNNKYYPDHGMFITVTDVGGPSSITVTIKSDKCSISPLSLTFTSPGGNGIYTLPTNFVYFNSGCTNLTGKPAVGYGTPATYNYQDTFTITASDGGGSKTTTVQIQDPNTIQSGSWPPLTPSYYQYVDLVWVGNNGCTKGDDGLCTASPTWKNADGRLHISYTGTYGTVNYLSPPCGTGQPDPICSTGGRDVYVEIDYMDAHALPQATVDAVVSAFAGMNPPITLHIIRDDHLPFHHDTTQAPSIGNAGNTEFDKIKKAYFGSATERTGNCIAQNPGFTGTQDQCIGYLLTAKRQAFHYVVITHNEPGTNPPSGKSEMPGNDIDISLGNFAGGTGTADDLAGTLMHELGHNFNLHHGGIDDITCKPNYLSVMNYAYQFSTFYGSTRPLSFSNALDPNPGPLSETPFVESTGISGGTGELFSQFIYGDYPNGNPKIGNFNTPLDVNNNGRTDDSINVALQNIPAAGCTDSTPKPLPGFYDRQLSSGNYQNIVLDMFKLGSTSMQDGAPAPWDVARGIP